MKSSYRELDIYVDSKKLAIEIHKMTLMLPKFELYEEGSQIRRSSKSVTAMMSRAMEESDIKRNSLNI